MAAATACAGLSGTLVLYIAAQFATWALHDGLQQWMFEQPGFERFGVTMALCLQARAATRAAALSARSALTGLVRRVAAAPPAPAADDVRHARRRPACWARWRRRR